jgi:hypothetical protein
VFTILTAALLVLFKALRDNKLLSILLLTTNTVAFAFVVAALSTWIGPKFVITIVGSMVLSLFLFLTLTYVPSLTENLTEKPAKMTLVAIGIMTVIQLSITIPIACAGYFEVWFIFGGWTCGLTFLTVALIDHYMVNTAG